MAVVLGCPGSKISPTKYWLLLAFGSGVLLSVLSYSLMHEAYRQSGLFLLPSLFFWRSILYVIEFNDQVCAPGTEQLSVHTDDLPEALSMGIGFATAKVD